MNEKEKQSFSSRLKRIGLDIGDLEMKDLVIPSRSITALSRSVRHKSAKPPRIIRTSNLDEIINPGVNEMILLRGAEPAFIGFGINADGDSRLNVYLKAI